MASISRNPNGSYKIRVFCGENKEGKQIVRTKTYTPSDPNLSYAKLTKEVQEAADAFEKEIRAASPRALENITVKQFAKKYLEVKETQLSPTTIQFYKKVINDYIVPMFGKMRLQDIRTYHVQQFITFLANDKKREDGRAGGIVGSTVKRYTTVMRSMLTLAYRMEYIDVDVGISRRLEFPKENKTEVEAFTLEEIGDILTALQEEPIHIRALIEMALFTGCRRGEIVGFKWADIDLDWKRVTVRRSIYKPHGEKAAEKEPKTQSSFRTISIPQHLVDTLTQYRVWQKRHISFMEDGWVDLDYVFTEEDGHVMNPQTPTKQFDHFLKRHNIRHLKFHGLRHTSATLLLSQGCDIKTVSKRLGHSDIETTNIYVHALEDMDKGAAQTLDDFINQRRKK